MVCKDYKIYNSVIVKSILWFVSYLPQAQFQASDIILSCLKHLRYPFNLQVFATKIIPVLSSICLIYNTAETKHGVLQWNISPFLLFLKIVWMHILNVGASKNSWFCFTNNLNGSFLFSSAQSSVVATQVRRCVLDTKSYISHHVNSSPYAYI